MSEFQIEIRCWLKKYLQINLDVDWLGQNVTLTELGLDSLARSELLVSLENNLGVPIPVELSLQDSDIYDFIASLECLYLSSDNECINSDVNIKRNYKTYINPYLATKLEQLKIDHTFVSSQGSYLYDEHGRKYIDFMAQYGALPFGHHPPQIWKAIQQLQSDTEPIFVQPSFLDSAGKLAKKLIAMSSSDLRYVTFSNSGAEAVEVAIKMARSATGRNGILSTSKSFHGKTFAALSATGNSNYQKYFGLPLEGFEYVEYGNSNSLEQRLGTKLDQFAAFIVEPIQGEGGVQVPPSGYLRQAKEICERHGVLLIVDEVQTGLGRTGALFACQEEGVCPDIMTLAKALGGGIVPIGATLSSEAAYSENFALKHSSTFAGNAIAARAGLATLELITQNDGSLLKHVKKEGAYLKERLQNIQNKFPWLIEEIRGRGFMLGIKFTSDRAFWQESFLGIAAQQKELAQFVASYLLNVEGVRLAPTLNGGDVLRIQPPLNASHEQCDQVIDMIERTTKVLASRQTGTFYRGILHKTKPIPGALAPLHTSENIPLIYPTSCNKNRFAFLLHPLDEQSYVDYDPTLAILTKQELHEFAESMDGLIDPVIGSTTQITSRDGTIVEGDFIMLSHTARQLKNMSANDALNVLRKGIELAKGRGSSIVGLGAYTSVVSAGGKLLSDMNIALTSGNSYTVVSGIEALDSAINRLEEDWSKFSACVLGATGAIGSCMSALLAERVSQLILVGNNANAPEIARQKLLKIARFVIKHVKENKDSIHISASTLAGQILRHQGANGLSDDVLIQLLESSGKLILTTNNNTLALADVVVSAISQPSHSIDHHIFKPGTLICDISRPRTFDVSIVKDRPDILIIDGGVIALPGSPRIGPYGIPKGTSYACMAETILLALDNHFQHTSLGRELKISEIIRQKELAKKHGFRVACLQSFGKVLNQQDWHQYFLSRSTRREFSLQQK